MSPFRKRSAARLGLILLWLLGLQSALAQTECDLSQPPPGKTAIAVGIYLVDLPEINDARQEFTADLFGTARWRDPRLENCTSPDLSTVWRPDLFIVNQRTLRPVGEPAVNLAGTEVRLRQRFFGSLAAPLDLRDFPRDQQTLVIEVSSLESPDDVALEVQKISSGQRENLTVSGWTISEGTAEISQLDAATGLAFPSIRFQVPAARNTTYYGWKVVLPMVVIVFMSWSVFWIHPSKFPPLIAVSTTSLLTLFAYQFSLTNLLPKVAYLTRMDYFSLGATVLVLLGLIESLVGGRMMDAGREDLALRMDRACRWLFPVALAGILAFAFI